MTTPWHESDDALLEELGASIRDDLAPTVNDRIELLMTGYDLVMLDIATAESTFDSLVSATDAVRADRVEHMTPRLLRFEGHGFRIEIEIDGVDLTGHIDPPPPGGRILLDTVSGSTTTEPDHELGSFDFLLPAGASFRLRLVMPDGFEVATPWIGADPAGH